MKVVNTFLKLVSLLAVGSSSLTVETGSLRADGLSEYLGLPDATPRLSWRLTSNTRADSQTAYQIQLASGVDKIENPDLWDSGKVFSTTPNALYIGNTLTSRSIAYWRVRAWDASEVVSAWSDIASFELALLDTSDWTASWIANTGYVTGKNSLPVFAKEFSVNCSPIKGRLYLLGLGQHDAILNGQDVSDEVLAPGYTTIDVTMLYSSYNITTLLVEGQNVLGVELGKGEYDPEPGLDGRYMRYTTNPVQLKLIAQLEWTCADYSNYTMISDESWLSTLDGPRIESSWYGGEEYDARKDLGEYSLPSGNRTGWSNATTSTSPGGFMSNPATPPLKIVDTITAVSVTQVGTSYRFDLGVNIAGFYEITMTASPGVRVVLTPGESLNSDGTIAQAQWTTGYPIFDAYTFATSSPETYRLKFMYHGFQYLMVNLTTAPNASDLKGLVIRSNTDAVGTFETSNSLFNSIHRNIDRSIQSNLYSVLTDCPHREKWGWLEESHLVFDPIARGYDLQAFGKNFARTMANAQTSSGLIPSTTPDYLVQSGAYGDDPNWGSTMILMPYMLYKYYGEVEVLSQNYYVMQAYFNYLTSKSSNYLLDYGLGDWVTVDSSTPIGVTATLAYAQVAQAMSVIATVLGKTSDATTYTTLHTNILSSFHSTYFNATANSYASGSQASNAIALDIGAVPSSLQSAVLTTLVNSVVSNSYHMTVGEIALPSLFRVLQSGGRNDILFQMMSLTEPISYGYEVTQGATSLWEEWDAITDGGSRNHFMLGYGDNWLQSIAGFSQQNTSIAYTKIDFKPLVVGDLTSASSTYRSSQGLVAASWVKIGSTLYYNISIPVGSTGFAYLNGSIITESGQYLTIGQRGVLSIENTSKSTATIGLGSGDYFFVID